MLFALPLVYAVSRLRVEWFFPAMLMVIGGRYLTFATVFGLRLYWALGGALALVSYVLVASHAAFAVGAFAGAATECLFAVLLLATARARRGVAA